MGNAQTVVVKLLMRSQQVFVGTPAQNVRPVSEHLATSLAN